MGEEKPWTWEWLCKQNADHKREAAKRGETLWTWEQIKKWMADCKRERTGRELWEKKLQESRGEEENGSKTI